MFEVFLYQASCVTRYTALERRQKIAREHKPPPKKLDADDIISGSEDHVKTLGASDEAQDAPPCNKVWLWRFRNAIDKDQKWSWAKNQQKLHKCFSYFRQFCGCCFNFSLPFSVARITHSAMNSELTFFCPSSLCSEILVKRHMSNRGQTLAAPEPD